MPEEFSPLNENEGSKVQVCNRMELKKARKNLRAQQLDRCTRYVEKQKPASLDSNVQTESKHCHIEAVTRKISLRRFGLVV